MGDDSEQHTGPSQNEPEREPVDLGRRRIARELETELGGLFGIELPDIERAIERLYTDMASGRYDEQARLRRIPEHLQRIIHSLDVVYEIARMIHETQTADEIETAPATEQRDEQPGEQPTARLHDVIDLMENYLERLRRLGES